MAQTTKIFTFDSSIESWTGYPQDASVTMSRNTSDGSPGTGCLQSRIYGKNKNVSGNYWEWTGTFEDLGVPAGSTVQTIGYGTNNDYNWRCSEYVTGASPNQITSFGIYNSGGTLIGNFSGAQTDVTGTTTWATVDGSVVNLSDLASNTTIRLRFYISHRTGNSASAAVSLLVDQVVLELDYTASNSYIDGTSAGMATASGTLSGLGELVGSSTGVTTLAGILEGVGELIGSSAGVTTCSGILVDAGGGNDLISGTSAGVATVTGVLQEYGDYRYWIGGTGNWSDTAYWSETSGGIGGATIPNAGLRAVFDANSFSAGGTVTVDQTAYCLSLNMSAVDEAVIFAMGTYAFYCFGDFILGANITRTGNNIIYLYGQGVHFINTYFSSFYRVLIGNSNSNYTLSSDITMTNRLNIDGTFDANDYNITCYNFMSIAGVVYMGNGTWEKTGTGTFGGNIFVLSATTYPEGSTLKLTHSGIEANVYINTNNKALNNLLIEGGAIPYYNLINNPEFNNIVIKPGAKIKLTAGRKFIVYNSADIVGEEGNLIEITSQTSAVHTLDFDGLGKITCDYLDLSYSTAIPANTWYAGGRSIDSGNNTGWIFADPIAGTSSGTSVLSGTLQNASTGGAISGTTAGTSAVTGTLQSTGKLIGIAEGTATVQGTLVGTGKLIGTSDGSATVTGTLYNSTPVGLAGQILGTATVEGILKASGKLSGTTEGVTTVTGHLFSFAYISGTISGSTSLSGTLRSGVTIAGTSLGTSTLTGTLQGAGKLIGASTGQAIVEGILKASGVLAGTISASTQLTGTLKASGVLAGTTAGQTILSGDLRDANAGTIRGASAGTSTLIGTLKATGTLSGTATGQATVTGHIYSSQPIAGTTAGSASVSGTLHGTGSLSGLVETSSELQGVLAGLGALSGITAGGTTVEGHLRLLKYVSALSEGSSVTSGTLTALGKLIGTSEGVTTIEGLLKAMGSLIGEADGSTTLTGLLTYKEIEDLIEILEFSSPVTTEASFISTVNDIYTASSPVTKELSFTSKIKK